MSKDTETEDRPERIENLFKISPPKFHQPAIEDENVAQNDTNKFTINSLTYKIIETDMVLLGCIHSIKSLSLEIELPCFTYGTLLIKSISDEFTDSLNKVIAADVEDELNLLTNIFEVGQYLPVKILQKNAVENGIRLILSTKPSDINANRNHKSFTENSLIWASVVEKSDHCYVLNAGIKNCKIILPFKNVRFDKNYVVGEPLYCVIKKCEIKQATTLTVSTLEKDLNSQQETMVNLNYLLPGTKVDFTIDQVSHVGLHGKVMNSYLSCIPQMFYVTPFSKSKEYKEGQTFSAQVMYTEPLTNFIYLKLNMEFTRPSHKIGEILTCRISSKTSNGVIVNFTKSEGQGLITFKRLLRAKKSPDAELSNVMSTAYKISSIHKCRVLDYNYMQNLYICIIEADVLKEKYFTLDDLKVGQRVTGKIKDIDSGGILVKVGNLQGFVSNLHISNVQYTDNVKGKFKIGQSVTVKILEIKNGNLLLTMKQGLLQSDNCLHNLEIYDRNKQYPGVVVHVTPSDVIVRFYNGVIGFLNKKELGKNIDQVEKLYYIGQVVPLYVKSIRRNQMYLSLEYKEVNAFKKLRIGSIVTGTVINCIDNETFILEITNENATAELPMAHLSENIECAKYLMERYKTGDEITDLMCIAHSGNKNIVSRRECRHFMDTKIPMVNKLQVGQVLRCSYNHIEDEGFIFTSAIIPPNAKIIVPLMDIADDVSDIKHLKLMPHQLVMVKIQNLNDGLNEIRGAAKLSQFIDIKYNEALDQLRIYFEEIEKCKEDLSLNKDPILNFHEGDFVIGTVRYLGTKGGCIVELVTGVKGIINEQHVKKGVNVGDSVKCVVLHVDYFGGYVDLSMLSKYITKFAKSSGEVTLNQNQTCFGLILLKKENFVVCLVTKENKNKFVYLPTKMHVNEFVPSIGKHEIHDQIKLFVLREVNTKIFGVSKHMMNIIEIRERTINEMNFKLQQLKKCLISKQAKYLKKRKLSTSEKHEEESDVEDNGFQDETNNAAILQETISAYNHLLDNLECNKIDKDLSKGPPTKTMKSEEEEHANYKNMKKRQKLLIDHIDDDIINNEEQNGIVDDNLSTDVNDDVAAQNKPEITTVNCNRGNKKSNITKESPIESTKDSKTKPVTKRLSVEKDNDNNSKKFKADYSENSFSCNGLKKPLHSGVSNFFGDTSLNVIDAECSASEDEATKNKACDKKEKMSAKERADLIRNEEERLREIETRLADSGEMPRSADEFDRLLLSEPDNSLLWTKYISYFVESTEIDKARVVAQRALTKIRPTEEQERFNIWIKLLNLENTFGTQESFEKTVEEAARCNDDFKIYMAVIDILGETQKFEEMDKKIKKSVLKFKQTPAMWIEIAQKLYKHKRIEEARKLKNDAIMSLQNKSTHLSVLLQFAKFEFDFGEKSQGESLYEAILLRYPHRIEVWTKYTDQLIKKKDYDLVRKVFGRAVSQSLGIKKMRKLVKAFLKFETQYGTPEDTAKVNDLANEYINIQS